MDHGNISNRRAKSRGAFVHRHIAASYGCERMEEGKFKEIHSIKWQDIGGLISMQSMDQSIFGEFTGTLRKSHESQDLEGS